MGAGDSALLVPCHPRLLPELEGIVHLECMTARQYVEHTLGPTPALEATMRPGRAEHGRRRGWEPNVFTDGALKDNLRWAPWLALGDMPYGLMDGIQRMRRAPKASKPFCGRSGTKRGFSSGLQPQGLHSPLQGQRTWRLRQRACARGPSRSLWTTKVRCSASGTRSGARAVRANDALL